MFKRDRSFPIISGLRVKGYSGQMIGVVLVALISVVPAAAQGQKQMSAGAEEAAEVEYLDAIQPQMIDPSSPGAIATGRVILYGRLIDPPYRLSFRGDTLLLNGVRVDPPIVPPWKQQKTPIVVSELAREIAALTGRIESRYNQLEAEGRVDLQQEILRYIAEEESIVGSAAWATSDKLHIVMATGEEFSMRLPPLLPVADYEETRERTAASLKNQYELNLAWGDLLVIGYGAVLTVPSGDVDRILSEINIAKRDGSVVSLAKVLYHGELAREVLFLENRSLIEEE